MQDAAPAGTGAMAAVIGAEDDLVRAACSEASGDEVVVPAHFTSPGQVVIGGPAAAVHPAPALLADKGFAKPVKMAVHVPPAPTPLPQAPNRLFAAINSPPWREP